MMHAVVADHFLNTTTREFTRADREEALRLLREPRPALESPPRVKVHRASAA